MSKRSGEIVINWSIDDGYVGHGPHKSSIYPDDFFYEDSKEEIMEQIDQVLKEDFEQTVSQTYEYSDVEEAAEKIMQYLKDKYADEDEV